MLLPDKSNHKQFFKSTKPNQASNHANITQAQARHVLQRSLGVQGLSENICHIPFTSHTVGEELLLPELVLQAKRTKHHAAHRKLLEELHDSFDLYVHGWAIEWPKRCAYWGWNQTRKFLSSRNYPIYDFTLNGCELGMRGRDGLLVFKRWRVVTTHSKVKENLVVFECSKSHEHSKNFNLRDTQHYPEGMMQAFFGALHG